MTHEREKIEGLYLRWGDYRCSEDNALTLKGPTFFKSHQGGLTIFAMPASRRWITEPPPGISLPRNNSSHPPGPSMTGRRITARPSGGTRVGGAPGKAAVAPAVGTRWTFIEHETSRRVDFKKISTAIDLSLQGSSTTSSSRRTGPCEEDVLDYPMDHRPTDHEPLHDGAEENIQESNPVHIRSTRGKVRREPFRS